MAEKKTTSAKGKAKASTKKKGKFNLSLIIGITVSIIITIVFCLGIYGYYVYKKTSYPADEKNGVIIYVPTGSSYEDVLKTIKEKDIIVHNNVFEWLLEKKEYKTSVKPGRYLLNNVHYNDLLKEAIRYNGIINTLKLGRQYPVKLTFNSVRTKEDLANIISKQIEADKDSIIDLFNNTEFVQTFGFEVNTIGTMFIPNTYEFYWNTSAEQFFERMAKEYKIFWNEERRAKAQNIGLSQSEATVLASIVEQETNKNDEKSQIAGVYLNRLKRNMRLQADPTVKFAIGDFSIKRIMKIHTEFNSRYNTYMYTGLPPGPICFPTSITIDAVLNRNKHNYLYFCAKEDFSGYHVFATNYAEHQINARKYQRALNRNKIK